MMPSVAPSKRMDGVLLMIRIPCGLGKRDLFVDLGAERQVLFAAEQGEQRIAIEVRSFLGPSLVTNLHEALGQFVLYEDIMELTEPDRILFSRRIRREIRTGI